MEQSRRKLLTYIRYTLTVIGVFLLIAAVIMLVLLVRSDREEADIQRPTMVTHRVLFLCAYNPLYFTYDSQVEGLKQALYPNGIEFDVVYMDAKNYGTDQDKLVFHDFLKERLKKDRGYEAVLLGDDDALSFALEYQEELFDGLPMVFFGINDANFAIEAAENPMITGFYEKDYLRDCIEMAIEAMPYRKTFVALHDESAAGTADMDVFYSYDQKYPDYVFTDIDTAKLTQKQLISVLERIPKDAVLFYMTCYSDCEGNTYSMLDRTNTVVRYADVPIIRNYSGGRDQGVLGGSYMDFAIQTRDAALIVVDVLENGTDISMYPLDLDTPSKTEFNYKLMQKYDIKEDMLPSTTIYVDKPVNPLEYYKDIIPSSVMIVLAMLSFIIASNIAVNQQREDNEQLLLSKGNLEKSRNKLRYQAEHDELSDLLNRRTIVETLNKVIKSDEIYSVMMIDIDGFKDVNENYGHSMADFIIKHLSGELKKMADEYKWQVGRYGGDEFIIMIPEANLDVDSKEVQMVLETFRKPIIAGEETIVLSASIGVSNSDGASFPEQHIINAEIAMYEAKDHGKNTAFVYADEMQRKIQEENKLKAQVTEAFDKDLFYMLYQPKIETATNKTIGFEALVRARNIDKGPSVFIPVIEKNGWIIRLGRIITEQVVKQLADWREQGKELLPISINFSSKQVNDIGFMNFLKELLEKYEIPNRYLQIEITESLLIEQNIQTKKLFEDFQDMGFRILMDDFGTGYSSLGYLIYIPIDEIKLDKSLVDAYLVPGKDSFIGDVIKLVHDMNKTIIIEGVEERWQYERLCEFNADAVQGFFFSRPLEADEAIDFKANV
ncbi:EAL domain-containing protein [Butyrivibrio sp. VCB2006]|uniref:EAL domain-containing protein n=1 Tax=Butyrivibrio sp. VCB2006 TaxID=1280679 RepID=UPI0018CA9400|nr:EAL domain-containing protein [Butyrivibrio sp. VCB2006]